VVIAIDALAGGIAPSAASGFGLWGSPRGPWVKKNQDPARPVLQSP